MKLGELVEILGGKLVQGTPEIPLAGVNSSALAGPSELAFAEDASSAVEALASNAGAVVLRAGSAESYAKNKCFVETDQPRLWFARAAKLLPPTWPRVGFSSIGLGRSTFRDGGFTAPLLRARARTRRACAPRLLHGQCHQKAELRRG